MYPNYSYQQVSPYYFNPFYMAFPSPNLYFYPYGGISHFAWHRQQPINGRATWTEGGPNTKCGIPWSENEFMTAAVGVNAPYQCGQSLKIRNTSLPGREIIVTVVDTVPEFSANQINLHRKAFEALGANPSVGVINVEIIPDPELEEEKWGKYLLEVVQTAYPNQNITDYNAVDTTEISSTKTKETYEFTLQSPQGQLKVRGNVVYNPQTNRVISFDISEMEQSA
ncbi:rare lipoprotein A [Oceanobacillus limi]|uniref:Rare lipoprotein A n=1 Tax=Oceanobacillus limi TaxID=930131 RepID=A0A1I0GAQ0_9BACI|nr:DUF3889 domain-containing protein [Oceanobacillus limi]SET67780.1 rare lipoprotein A [Oceanobacillus limi]